MAYNKVLDLFSGIGGFSLGLESVGFETVGFCEIDAFCRRILHKHWPGIPVLEDIRDVDGREWRGVQIVTGGFPCQDLSLAGKRAGLQGERSGLWSELRRVIVEAQPRWAIIENVPGLRTLGADRVLAELAGAGYTAWPLVVGAVHAGAPHRRQRVWIVAHAEGIGRAGEGERGESEQPGAGSDGEAWNAPYPTQQMPHGSMRKGRGWAEFADIDIGQPPDTNGSKCHGSRVSVQQGRQEQARNDVAGGGRCCPDPAEWAWDLAPEPVLRRVDDGVPCGMDRTKRLKALGNSVVPQVVAAIGRAILQVNDARTTDITGGVRSTK